MFCTRCGKELSDDVSFCPNCGVKVLKHESDPDEDVTLETEPLAETTHNKSKENLEIAQIVGKNAEYYLAEFQKIESHQKPRFNWAAFLLNIAFCFYRKCGFLFKKYFLIPIILYFATSALFNFGMLSLNITLTIAGGVLFILASIFLLVNGIRFGRNFNKEYYEHCKTVTSVSQCGVSIKGIVLTYVVILAVSVLVSIIAGAVALNSINSLIEDSYTDLSIGDSTYDDYDTIPEPSYSDPTAPAEDYSEGVVMMSNSYLCDFDSSYAVITIEYHEEITDPDNQYVTADYILSDTDEVIIHLEGFATTVDDYEIMLEDETGLCLDIVKPNFDELFVTTSGENMPGITFEGQYYAF